MLLPRPSPEPSQRAHLVELARVLQFDVNAIVMLLVSPAGITSGGRLRTIPVLESFTACAGNANKTLTGTKEFQQITYESNDGNMSSRYHLG